MSNFNRGPSKDASYQNSDSFGQAVTEGKIFEKSTNQKQELSVKPLGQMNRNFVGSIIGKSSIKTAHLISDSLTNMATTDNSCF
jgi:hypothetical protein